MKACSGKPCNEQGDCEHCGMADGPEICPKCGSELEYWEEIRRVEDKHPPRMGCPKCGYETRTISGHEEKVGEKR